MKRLKGMHDIYFPEIMYYDDIAKTAKDIFLNYGFFEIQTPVLEETAVFKRSVGEETDIVSKEMYSFEDRDGKNICLRPENTASVVRAYLENKMSENLVYNKLFYIGPMFRRERPQRGRYREFYQIGAEFLNNPDPSVEVELLSILQNFFLKFGINDLYTEINSLGCKECRPSYRLKLIDFLKKSKGLCEDCSVRRETNPLRVFDCKKKECKDNIIEAPSPISFLCPECGKHYSKLIEYLSEAQINYVENKFLVRGLDYYTRSVFEIKSHRLGAQDTLCGGGRYDDLVELMGGAKTPAAGFSMGLERLVIVLEELKYKPWGIDFSNDLFVAALGDEAKRILLPTILSLKKEGFKTESNLSSDNLKKLMRAADKSNAKFVFIVGDAELKKGMGILRDMKTKKQYDINLNKVQFEIIKHIKEA